MEELNQSLINSYNEKMSFIENKYENLISESNLKITQSLNKLEKTIYNHEPMKFKISSLTMSFLTGMLTMMILLMLVWYQWIRPYQIDESLTTKSQDGKVFLWIPKQQMSEQDNHYYLMLD